MGRSPATSSQPRRAARDRLPATSLAACVSALKLRRKREQQEKQLRLLDSIQEEQMHAVDRQLEHARQSAMGRLQQAEVRTVKHSDLWSFAHKL